MQITAGQLEVCNTSLDIYDIAQEGWEQEPNGFEANAKHVLTHLNSVITGKNFKDPKVAELEIAPDCMQYALRLARWTNQSPEEMVAVPRAEQDAKDIPITLGSREFGLASFIAATKFLAANSHDHDHAKTKETAAEREAETAKRVGGLLIHCAQIQASVYHFDPVEAFKIRLAGLRERFGISGPQDEVTEIVAAALLFVYESRGELSQEEVAYAADEAVDYLFVDNHVPVVAEMYSESSLLLRQSGVTGTYFGTSGLWLLENSFMNGELSIDPHTLLKNQLARVGFFDRVDDFS